MRVFIFSMSVSTRLSNPKAAKAMSIGINHCHQYRLSILISLMIRNMSRVAAAAIRTVCRPNVVVLLIFIKSFLIRKFNIKKRPTRKISKCHCHQYVFSEVNARIMSRMSRAMTARISRPAGLSKMLNICLPRFEAVRFRVLLWPL